MIHLPDPTGASLLLPDPTGASLLLPDANGNEAGHVLYDPYGGVLTSTIPATLTATLAGAPDPATGLVHLGNGRWYDPAMGRPLQPNPAGGPPTVPQALNRYAATLVGQPGVAEGAGNAFLSGWWRDNWYRQGASAFVSCATCVLSEIKTTERLFSLRLTLGAKTYTGQDLFRQVGKSTYQNIANQEIWTAEQFLVGVFEPAELNVRWTGSRQVDNILKRLLVKRGARTGLNIGAAAILDVGFEGLEYATGTGRWGNPYWTGDQKVWQGVFSISGDLLIVGAIAAWNPELWIAVPVYFVASVAWSAIHPVIFPGQFKENRNLAPLGQ